MFDIDRWQEIFSSIRNNLLRTFLSGFTIALGLFIFIVLFGIGRGMENGFMKQFTGEASNIIRIFTGETTVAYDGLQDNRKIELNNENYQEVLTQYQDKIEYSTAKLNSSMKVKYGNESGDYQISGAMPDEQIIEQRKLVSGRYLNQADFQNASKVVVIGRMVQRDLIKKGNPLGRYLDMNGVNYAIVGVFSDEGGDEEERIITMPIVSLQQIQKSSNKIDDINITYNKNLTVDQAIDLGKEIEKSMKANLRISPDDNGGITVRNNAENLDNTFQFLFVLGIIVSVIGGGTLLAGILGISNIMVFIVKERTKEIGVRKAIGAKPNSIVSLILQESVVITVVSGLVGSFLGILCLSIIGDSLQDYFIYNPNVSIGVIMFAFFSLVVAGLIAGFVPAYKASKIKPIEALRSE